MSETIHIAGPAELDDWDARTVEPPGGNVLQSRIWAAHRARTGWAPLFLRFDDGFGVLALTRRWPVMSGASAYLPRGPIAAGEPVERTAARLVAATAWLGGRGVDVVATDAEIAAETGYPALLAAAGFRPIEEIEPSRHRLALPLGAGGTEASAFAAIAKPTRQRIRAAESADLLVVRHDRRTEAGGPGPGFVDPEAADRSIDQALAEFHDLLSRTGERVGFRLAGRDRALAWWAAAFAAGYLILLEARDPAGRTVAGLLLYRHGGRLTSAHSADRPEVRRELPGSLHLLRWRAVQLAIREGCPEMDLGGVDVRGARREPLPGEPTHGLLEHKCSFGAVWLEQTGAHERVVHRVRQLAGRAFAALSYAVRRD